MSAPLKRDGRVLSARKRTPRRVSCHMRCARSSPVMLARVSSIAETIPDQMFRRGCAWLYKFSKRCGVWYGACGS